MRTPCRGPSRSPDGKCSQRAQALTGSQGHGFHKTRDRGDRPPALPPWAEHIPARGAATQAHTALTPVPPRAPTPGTRGEHPGSQQGQTLLSARARDQVPTHTTTPRLRITYLLPKPHLLALPISQSPAATAARHTGRWQVWNVRREAGSQPPPLLLTTGGGGASVSQT